MRSFGENGGDVEDGNEISESTRSLSSPAMSSSPRSGCMTSKGSGVSAAAECGRKWWNMSYLGIVMEEDEDEDDEEEEGEEEEEEEEEEEGEGGEDHCKDFSW